MDRRELLTVLSLSVGGGLVLPNLLASCRDDDYVATFFETKDIELINQIGEVILPETPESGGAKTANVAHFIDFFAAKGLSPQQKEILLTGIRLFREGSKEADEKPFLRLSSTEQHNVLVKLDKESKRLTTDAASPHYFKLLKDLILFAYFTSEVGATEALRYEAVPGKFIGDYPYKEGEGAWAL